MQNKESYNQPFEEKKKGKKRVTFEMERDLNKKFKIFCLTFGLKENKALEKCFEVGFKEILKNHPYMENKIAKVSQFLEETFKDKE